MFSDDYHLGKFQYSMFALHGQFNIINVEKYFERRYEMEVDPLISLCIQSECIQICMQIMTYKTSSNSVAKAPYDPMSFLDLYQRLWTYQVQHLAYQTIGFTNNFKGYLR